jgi:N-acetylglucosaminyldiphosphoundecaprenol N-acetyl-beta-D-mannosaminyltransferase
LKSYNFLGISVNPLTIKELNCLIAKSIEKNEKNIISNHNLHSLYIYHHNEKMREFYKKSKYVHIDGMSLVFLGKLFRYPLERCHRVTYVDWIHPLMKEAEKKQWRIFFLGSKPGVAQKASEILTSKYPELQIMTHHGYFDSTKDSTENCEVIKIINGFNPHILMVGMGMPRQEQWISENFQSISANVFLTAGACMDYVAGVVPTPPRWIGRIGLEWLYRLISEPGRLWKRYLVEPWFIVKLIIIEIFSNLKRFKY